MATVDLMQIYEDIFVKKISHCALCYRSDAETRLVKSVVFKKVVQAMKYSQVFMKNEKLCYMCEAHMVSVAKFVDMLHLALEVQRVFKRAEMSSKYKKKIMAGSLKFCQKDFAKFRKKMQLYRTNTLVVDSLNDSSKAPPSPPAPPAPPIILYNSYINPMFPALQTVLLNDKVPAEKVQIEIDTATPMHQLDPLGLPFSLANSTNNVILSIGTDNNLYMVPALTIDGSSGNALTSFQTDAPKKNVKKRPNEGIKTSYKTAKYTVLPTIVDCRTDNDAFKEESLLGDAGTDTKVQPVPEVVKLPIRTDSEVDWEDKIPMEVISFVDDEPVPKAPDKLVARQPVADQKDIIDLC